MAENLPSITPTKALAVTGDDITNQIIEEQDPDKLANLTQLFKLNQRKKDIVRTNKLSRLLDTIDDEMISRITSEPDSFDHDQLLNYMVATQKAVKGIEDDIQKAPQINIMTNQEININNSGLDRASREKVLDVISNIMGSIQTPNEDDVIDI